MILISFIMRNSERTSSAPVRPCVVLCSREEGAKAETEAEAVAETKAQQPTAPGGIQRGSSKPGPSFEGILQGHSC